MHKQTYLYCDYSDMSSADWTATVLNCHLWQCQQNDQSLFDKNNIYKLVKILRI